MSDDDLVRRGDAIEALCGRMDREEYGHAKAAVALDIEEIRSLPAVPPSPAERLDLDPESLAEAMCAAEFGSAAWGSHPDDGPLRRRFRTRANYVIVWFSAYRAAKPGSTGAAPPAAEPGVTRTRCTIIQTAPTPLQFDPEEPAAEPAPRTTTTGAIVSALSQMGLAQLAEPAKPDLPWGTDIGPSDYMTPAADPASFQKPGSFLDEAAVRCNNPEPAAQPFRHGRCCAEEPKEPAPRPSPYARCGGHGWIGNPNPAPPDGMDSMEECPGCPDCVRAAKEPAPCGTCGGSGRIGRNTITDGLLIEGRKPCPSCSHGGAA